MSEPDQRYYWTPEWQEGEREAEAEIAAGDVLEFDSAADAIAWLQRDDAGVPPTREDSGA